MAVAAPVLLVLALALTPSGGAVQDASTDLVVARDDARALRVPRDEKLVFRVRVSIAFVDADVGKVTMRSSVEPYRASLLAAPAAPGAGADEPEREIGVLSTRAVGSYAWYSMDASIETRVLPQDWPRVTHRYTHDGSERRRRELQIGLRDDGWGASYRRDTDKNAPKGTRIWRDAKTRSVPTETLDLLSAVYLARELTRGEQELSFPLLDKLTLWQMHLTRGRERRIETPAGTFDALEIRLDPAPYPGEEIDEEDVERFEGLFGLHGSIHLWVDRATGVPVRVQGELPAGPLDLEVDVSLESYSGTPEAFAPLSPEKKR